MQETMHRQLVANKSYYIELLYRDDNQNLICMNKRLGVFDKFEHSHLSRCIGLQFLALKAFYRTESNKFMPLFCPLTKKVNKLGQIIQLGKIFG